MNRLKTEKRAQIIGALCEGNSIRSTCRMTGADIKTVLKLLASVGKACAEYQDKVFHDLPCKRIEADEVWTFVYAKEKNVPEDFRGQFGFGDVWTFTALCADSKLVPSWRVGRRDLTTATEFMKDLAGRMKNRVQLTTDGHRAYLNAVEDAFGKEVDYSMLIKLYGNEGGKETEKKYSPAECTGAIKERIQGDPDMKHVSTSYVERQNLTMRMNMRRFTRLTNAFSKKIENHIHAISLYFMYYNFCRVHQTLRVTPAMEAKVTDHVWSIEEILSLKVT